MCSFILIRLSAANEVYVYIFLHSFQLLENFRKLCGCTNANTIKFCHSNKHTTNWIIYVFRHIKVRSEPISKLNCVSCQESRNSLVTYLGLQRHKSSVFFLQTKRNTTVDIKTISNKITDFLGKLCNSVHKISKLGKI